VAKAIAEGRIPRVSQLERDVGAVLNRLGVRTEAQFRFRLATGRFGAVVDFYLPDSNTVVEVNGTFWHVDPRVFPNGPIHPSQKRTLERYARKTALLQEQNIPLIEVWELDFRADPEGTVRKALSM
jgi:G:T-mismatch repair DNA endonuclease (very short patch repair protein)